MCFYNPFYDGKAKAGAGSFFGFIDLEEAIPYLFLIRFGDTDTVILHNEEDTAFLPIKLDMNVSAISAVLDGILNQIRNHAQY